MLQTATAFKESATAAMADTGLQRALARAKPHQDVRLELEGKAKTLLASVG